jgi:hypothetical protein
MDGWMDEWMDGWMDGDVMCDMIHNTENTFRINRFMGFIYEYFEIRTINKVHKPSTGKYMMGIRLNI